MRALLKLAWLETKIFAREPLGLIGALILPTVIVIGIGRTMGGVPPSSRIAAFVSIDLPVFAAITAALNAVLSLVTIVSIYREGGILKRLRATPLRPAAILGAHVLVKIAMTLITLVLMMLAGRRVLGLHLDARSASFMLAALVSMASIVSIGFLLASVRALSDADSFGRVLPGGGPAAVAEHDRARLAIHVCGVVVAGDLARAAVGCPPGRRCGARDFRGGTYCCGVAAFPLEVAAVATARAISSDMALER